MDIKDVKKYNLSLFEEYEDRHLGRIDYKIVDEYLIVNFLEKDGDLEQEKFDIYRISAGLELEFKGQLEKLEDVVDKISDLAKERWG